MTVEPEQPETVALGLVGWVEGGLHRGSLADSPAWWVDGIRERLRRMDALYDQALARMATRLAEAEPGR